MTKRVLADGKVVDFCSDLQGTGQSKRRDVRCILKPTSRVDIAFTNVVQFCSTVLQLNELLKHYKNNHSLCEIAAQVLIMLRNKCILKMFISETHCQNKT